MAAHHASKKKSARTTRVVVAGDVCIDWLSVPVESRAARQDGSPKQDEASSLPGQVASPPMNWQLRGGRHMYANRGGAWLTADFVKVAVGKGVKVSMSGRERSLASVPPKKIIHSMLMLGSNDRVRDHEKIPHWVVTNFEGYAGPTDKEELKVKKVEQDDGNAQVVLLDDAGNGFRNDEKAWPKALEKGRTPLVLYKVRRPLGRGELWKRLEAFHLPRTVAQLTADELRGEGGSISRELSWERTATDLILSLAREPKFAGLRSCPFMIITLNIEGAVLVRCEKDQVSKAHLWYYPNLSEGQLLRSGRGDMSGFGSAFAAAVAAELAAAGKAAHDLDKLEEHLRKGISNGLTATYNLLEEAFGPCLLKDEVDEKNRKRRRSKKASDEERTERRAPRYPSTPKLFESQPNGAPKIFNVPLPPLPNPHSPKETTSFRSWRILDSNRDGVFSDLAAEVARLGAEKVFKDVPIGQFGKASSAVKLTTLERSEIESYRSIRNLIREFMDNPRPERPLCLAVFGAPGSGKSFGVTQVARSLDTEGIIEKLDFNVSQWNSPDYLVSALHRVRDHAIQGKVPLVFFDEFDSQLGLQRLGWLRYFLAPMQDGVFADGPFTHDIGKAIFVFAGGTADTFAEFSKELSHAAADDKATAAQKGGQGAGGVGGSASGGQNATGGGQQTAKSKDEESKSVKLPDFVSRLRGHVDVFGLDPPVDTNLLRRALVLRSNILKKFPKLKDASGALRMDGGVLRAFLQVPKYFHGARSVEAILDMSRLGNRPHFDPSLLPPLHQLNLHVDGDAFTALVQHQQLIGEKLEEIAREVHERYRKEELAGKDKKGKAIYTGKEPKLQSWEILEELYKKSKREQAAGFPMLLAAARCGFEKEDDKPEPKFEFSPPEVAKLARMEHERRLQERRIKQPDHSALVPWSKLDEKDRERNANAVRAIPEILGKVKLRVVRLV
jgi:hypothetical protein